MKKKLTIIIIVLVMLLLLLILGINNYTNQETSTNTIVANTTEEEDFDTEETEDPFSLSFLKYENNEENIIYSPLSIKYALNMLKDGASGNTYTQIEEVLENLDLTTYQNIEDTLSLANAMFVKDTYYGNIKKSYSNTLLNKYNAEIIEDDFTRATNINSWIEEKTLGLISNLLTDDMLTNVNLMLVNALAIDMNWEYTFSTDDTTGEDFYLVDGSTMNATTMKKETSAESFYYYVGEDLTALTMNLQEYDEKQLEVMILMPDGDLSEYVDNFDVEDLEVIEENLTSAADTKDGIYISVPKFSFDYELNLQEDLEYLGITDIFDSSADLSNISDDSLYVSKAIHKATIDFTEKGVKAAAVTAMMISSAMLEEQTYPIEVTINNPFLFIIRDKQTQEIWFVGTVYEPNSWEDDMADYQ